MLNCLPCMTCPYPGHSSAASAAQPHGLPWPSLLPPCCPSPLLKTADRVIEERELKAVLRPLGLRIQQIPPDGHCLYRSLGERVRGWVGRRRNQAGGGVHAWLLPWLTLQKVSVLAEAHPCCPILLLAPLCTLPSTSACPAPFPLACRGPAAAATGRCAASCSPGGRAGGGGGAQLPGPAPASS